mmetsp:Transcript_83486/g.258121  ORF Transcript_83486/g.258121 Transcript_83486/m.258121 type:complete len:88 (-) Transcript_83486:254-517(-)
MGLGSSAVRALVVDELAEALAFKQQRGSACRILTPATGQHPVAKVFTAMHLPVRSACTDGPWLLGVLCPALRLCAHLCKEPVGRCYQ